MRVLGIASASGPATEAILASAAMPAIFPPVEIDALLGAVVELGALVEQPMPLCRSVLALVRERARVAGCY